MLELGVKHIRFGVKPEMFPIMGEALIDMLEDSLKDAFDEKCKAHWIETYATLSGDMILGQMNAKKNGR
jgi:hemoglobin-like flavoprotein